MSIVYKIWLSIIATTIVNLSTTMFSAWRKLKPQLETIGQDSQELTDEVIIQGIEASMVGEKTNQLDDVRKRNIVKVAVIGDKAYWVHNNTFFVSDVVNGFIDNTAAKPVDAYSLSNRNFSMLLDVLDHMS